MAAIALNKFRTIRVPITTTNVGIYTCPIGVATIVILAQVTNVSDDVGIAKSIYDVTAIHARDPDPVTGVVSFKIANRVPVPPNDGYNLIADGRLALETNDSIQISANANNALELILSVLETAKQ
jgi:hypothetical protein